MSSDSDDPLKWDGDEEAPKTAPSLPSGWNAVGKGHETVGRREADGTVTPADAGAAPMSTAMLLTLGVLGGVYLLYTVGWIIGGLNTQPAALFLIPGLMYHIGLWTAVLAPALWFAAVWMLTRTSSSWVRVLGLLGGVVLLVPWPFVMTGVVGA